MNNGSKFRTSSSCDPFSSTESFVVDQWKKKAINFGKIRNRSWKVSVLGNGRVSVLGYLSLLQHNRKTTFEMCVNFHSHNNQGQVHLFLTTMHSDSGAVTLCLNVLVQCALKTVFFFVFPKCLVTSKRSAWSAIPNQHTPSKINSPLHHKKNKVICQTPSF